MLVVLLKSLIIGALLGFGVGAGAARMFHAPETQGMGAFRTLGEMNACEGDPISHFSFGFGFFLNAWATVVGTGALTQDVAHRIVPNWSAGTLLIKNKDVKETMHNPKKMAIVGAIIGAVVLMFLNISAAAVPESLKTVANAVLTPAANNLINLVMPIVFWLAALDAGRHSGFWGTILGGIAQLIMGNAVPGVVLGILLGKGLEDSGWTKVTRMILIASLLIFLLSGFFREMDVKLIEQLGLQAPQWLIDIHATLKGA